jgi:hypothetical protein
MRGGLAVVDSCHGDRSSDCVHDRNNLSVRGRHALFFLQNEESVSVFNTEALNSGNNATVVPKTTFLANLH